jgi:hypothetical protein
MCITASIWLVSHCCLTSYFIFYATLMTSLLKSSTNRKKPTNLQCVCSYVYCTKHTTTSSPEARLPLPPHSPKLTTSPDSNTIHSVYLFSNMFWTCLQNHSILNCESLVSFVSTLCLWKLFISWTHNASFASMTSQFLLCEHVTINFPCSSCTYLSCFQF